MILNENRKERIMRRAKRFLALFLAAALLLLTGCGYFDTKMARAIQKLSKLDSLHLCVELELQAELSALGQSMPLEGSIQIEGDAALDPLLAELELDLNLPGLDELLHCYVEKGDEVTNFYLRRNDGTLWQKTGALDRDASVGVDTLKYFIDGFSTFEAAEEETASIEGATRYDGLITADFLNGLLEIYTLRTYLTEDLGLDLPEAVFEAMKDVPTSLWMDEKGRIVRLELELGELLTAVSEPILQSFGEKAGLDALALSLHLTGGRGVVELSNFDGVDDLSLPAEVAAAWGAVKQPWEG